MRKNSPLTRFEQDFELNNLNKSLYKIISPNCHFDESGCLGLDFSKINFRKYWGMNFDITKIRNIVKRQKSSQNAWKALQLDCQ